MNIVKGRLFIVAAAVLLYPSTTMGCSCIYGGEFSEYSSAAAVIVRARVVSYGLELSSIKNYYETMQVEVTDVVKGDPLEKVITIYGDTGMSCLSYIAAEKYPLGSEHLIALRDNSGFQPLGGPIPPKGCGEASVRIVGNQVEGVDRSRSTYTYELSEFLNVISGD